MKKHLRSLLVIFSLLVSINKLTSQSFFASSIDGNLALNCGTTVVTMVASGSPGYSYTWTTSGNTLYTNYINITAPGTWTVYGQIATSSVITQQTFAITQSIIAPTIAITPTVNNVICTGGTGCFTLTSNLGPNVTTNWFAVMGSNTVYVGVAQGTINIFCPGSPGVYWGESINNLTGCKATKSVQVTSSVGVPAFTITSPTNFIVGCATASMTSMQVNTVITSPVPNVPVNYTFMVPPVTSTPTTFTSSPNLNNITVPGIYVVYVKDQTNNCIASQSISVIQNTVGPNIYCIQSISILSCNYPTMTLTGISNNTNTAISWSVPPTPPMPVNPFPTQTVTINPAVLGATTNITSVGVYTVGAIDNSSLCRTNFTIQIIQDLRKPIFTITHLTNSVISCSNPSVTLVPVVTPTLAVALVPTYIWYPPPFTTGYPGTQYDSYTPGTHSAIATSGVNGCTFSATYNIAADNSIGAFGGIVGVSCPITTAVVSPTFATSISNLTFTWTGPPSSILSSVNQSTILVNTIGVYTCAITSLSNSCTYTIFCSVQCANGLLSQNFSTKEITVYPNPSNGTLNIELSFADLKAKLSVFDTQGKLLLEKPLLNKSNKLEMDLPKGYYLYRITGDNKVLKKDKLIIE